MSKREDVSNRYISSAMHRDGVDTTLSRMLGDDRIKVGSLTASFCAECGEKTGFNYPHPTDPTIIYCKQHYEQLVAPTCEGCGRGIVGSAIVNDGLKKYHQQCFSKDHTCCRCSQPIIGSQLLMALEKEWHSKCFTCTLCSTQISNNYAERDGKPYCKKCNSDLNDPTKHKMLSELYGYSGGDLTSTSHTEVANKNKEIQDRNQVKTGLYSNVQKGKDTCNWCRKIITSSAIQFGGNLFCSECFMCTSCGKVIGNDTFVNHNDQAYCRECGQKQQASTKPTCGGCHKPITTTYTVAGSTKYHPQCLVCSQCKGTLEKGYLERQGNLFCGNCARSTQSTTTTTSTNIPGGRKGGMVVDPRSGKRTYL